MKIWIILSLSIFVFASSNVFATWAGATNYQSLGVNRNPQNLAALLRLGATLERQGDFSGAVTVYELGLKTRPGHEQLLKRYRLAKSNLDEAAFFSDRGKQKNVSLSRDESDNAIKCRKEKAQSAIQACRLALKVNPLRADMYEFLGDAYRSTGNPKQAIWAYQKAIDLDKNNSRLIRKRTALTTITGVASNSATPVPPLNPNNASVAGSTGKSTALYPESLSANRETQKTATAGYAGDEDLIGKMKLLTRLNASGLISDADFSDRKQVLLNTVVDVNRAKAGYSTLRATDQSNANPTALDFGSFHALVIGNDKYETLQPLASAVADAEAIALMLKGNYGFSVKVLTNATRYEILYELSALRSVLSEHDNLLIYYAGHGHFDDATNRGYWLPVDAEEHNFANWISTTDVTDALSGTLAKHAMVIADSCFSGSLLRTANLSIHGGRAERTSFIARLISKRSRTVLTSGSLEPVLDSGAGKHSIFANALLTTLDENDGYLEANRLFTQLRQKVVLNSDQTPQYASIRKAGHEGGDFVFVRRR